MQKGKSALVAYCDPPEATASCVKGYTELLREIIGRIIDYCNKKDALVADLSVEKRVRDTMKQALVGVDEETLRSRVPENAEAIFASQSREALDRSRGYLTQQIIGCDRQREEAEKRLIELESTTEDPAALISCIEDKKAELDRLRVSYDAVMLAMESIEGAGVSLRAGVTPRLCDGASKRMERLTDGKYKGLSVDSDIKLSVTSDMTRDISVLSCGTRDAAYLSLRFSMIEMLFGKDMPCITIDEGLSQLDDIRARSMLSVLDGYCEDGGQCIIFTCHSREATLLEADEIKYNRITLN